MIEHLPRVVPAAPGAPAGAGVEHPMRQVTVRVAADPASWDDALAAEVAAFFDELADGWHTRASQHRHEPVLDALMRGGKIRGPVLEVGSGTGLTTAMLSEVLGEAVLALDLSWEMLRRAPAGKGPRMQADASRLPFRPGSLGTIVLENAFLFGPQVDEALAPDGAVVWVNSNGSRTPIHLPIEMVAASLPGDWGGVASEAGWGTWGVLRRVRPLGSGT